MSAPGEHKTVQARIQRYAQEIGWTFVPRAEAEARRGFNAEGVAPAERSRAASLRECHPQIGRRSSVGGFLAWTCGQEPKNLP